MPLHSKDKSVCGVCNDSIRRDKLDLHFSRKHPGQTKLEKGFQRIDQMFRNTHNESSGTAASTPDCSNDVSILLYIIKA